MKEFIAGVCTGLLVVALVVMVTPAGAQVASGQAKNGYWIPPTCPADTSTLEFGSICKDPVIGRLKFRDADGVRIVVGVAP